MSQEMVVENFYNVNIKDKIDLELTEKENELALKVFKSISYTIWCDNMMSKEVLEEFLYGYNRDNLLKMLTNLINTVRELNIDKPIFMRDFSDIPKHFIFYNQEIEHREGDNKLKTIFRNIEIFSTKDVTIGAQVGTINEQGAVELSHFEESIYDEEGCYIMLSFKETTNMETNTSVENIFLDYYLGNNDLE